MSQFKVYRCGRERKKCAVMMADEYFKSAEYTKALTLYSLMLSDYRQEKWFTIFTEILLKTIQSSILGASVNDFVAASVEALSPSIKIGKIERQNILENLWKVFNVSLVAHWLTSIFDIFLIFSERTADISKSNRTRNQAQLGTSSCQPPFTNHHWARRHSESDRVQGDISQEPSQAQRSCHCFHLRPFKRRCADKS